MIHVDVHAEKGERFKVLRTSDRTQLATMTLPAGATTSNDEGNTQSDQVIYVVEGRIELTAGDDKRELRAGEAAIVPAATPTRIRVMGRRSATLFNIYGPPAFPAEESAETRAEAGAEPRLPSSFGGGYGGGGFGSGGY